MCEPEQSELPLRGIALAAGAAVAVVLAVVLVVKLGWFLVIVLIVVAMIAVALRQLAHLSVRYWPSEGYARPPAQDGQDRGAEGARRAAPVRADPRDEWLP